MRGHWAQQWILPVVRAGVMDTQPNYTFQPAARVRRGDLAQTVSRVLDADRRRQAGGGEGVAGRRVKIADVRARPPELSGRLAGGGLGRHAAGRDGAFQLLRPGDGAEVVDVVARLEALAKP